MRRALAGWIVCLAALGVGMLTAALAAENRARGDELDRLERWCEAQARRNELQRLENRRAEWHLLGEAPPAGAPALAAAEARPAKGAALP